MIRLTVSLWLFAAAILLWAQKDMTFLNIGLKQGLSNEFVNDIAMDEQGFIWAATESGLNRIAGNKCTAFRTHNSGIADDASVCLYYDKERHSIWILFKNGEIDVFDCRTQSFKHLAGEKGMLPRSVATISGAADGGIWIGYHSGDIQHYNPSTRQFTTLQNRLLPNIKNGIRKIIDGRNGRLYIGLRMDGMCVYNLKTHAAKLYAHNPADRYSLPGNNVRSICIDHMQNVWVGTNLGLALFDETANKFRTFRSDGNGSLSLAGDNIYQIIERSDHSLWIASDIGGISVVHLDQCRNPYTEPLSFEHITRENSGLSSNNIRKIVEDAFGNIWVGLFGTGVDFISKAPSEFHSLSINGRPISNSSSICSDHLGNLWIGQENIICLYQNGTVKGQWCFKGNISNSSALVYTLKEDHNGCIWLGTNDNGVLKFDPASHRFTRYPLIQALDVNALCETKDGTMWIGSEDGLFSVANDVATRETKMNRLMGRTNPVVYSILQDDYSQLWIGTRGQGVYVLGKDKKVVAHLNDDNVLKSSSVNQIAKDSDGGIWIATFNGLTYIENPLKPTSVKIYDERQGIRDGHIRAVCHDKAGNIWVSMFAGIACLDLHEQRFYNYDFQSGIPVGNFAEASAASAPDGTIFLGSPSGICYFNPQLLTMNKNVAQVEIIGCERLGRLSDQTTSLLISPERDGTVRLRHDDNTFKICFTTQNYAEEGKVEYSYTMMGLDEQWYETDGNKEVTFQNMEPGHYTFIVRAKLKNQGWKEATTATLKVVVTPPLWLTWWARLIYILFALGAAALIFYHYRKQLLLRNSLARSEWESHQKQEANEERLRFFTNITHELRTPLTLISGPLEDLKDDQRLPEWAHKKICSIHASAERLLNLINDILEFRKAETQNRKLSVARANLGYLIKEIGTRFKDLNHNPNLRINIDVQEGMPDVFFDSEVITTVVCNLMSNAIKYTPSGSVTLSLKAPTPSSAAITVEDTGYGISEDALPRICERYYQENGKHQASGTGIGLALVKSLAELHEAELHIESHKGTGSTFSFILNSSNTYPEALHKDDEKIDTKEMADASDPAKPTQDGAEECEAEQQQPLLLIVEDNNDIRQYIEESLRDDYRILQACNGKEGLNLALQQMPDLIVSDIMMPEMDGIMMTLKLRDDIRTSHVPIILLTAKTSAADQQEGYDCGADSYLMKPFSAKLLQSRIRNILSGRRRLAEHRAQRGLAAALQADSDATQADRTADKTQKGNPDDKRPYSHDEEEPAAQLCALDRMFMEKLNSLIEKHIYTDDLNIAFMTDKMAMSHPTFYRKVKALTGMSANEYIKKAKLRKSMTLLQTRLYSVSEVAAMTGFNNMGNFRESFKREFGMNPSDVTKARN